MFELECSIEQLRYETETVCIMSSSAADAALYGWFAAAHIDADFDNSHESVSVCLKVSSPV